MISRMMVPFSSIRNVERMVAEIEADEDYRRAHCEWVVEMHQAYLRGEVSEEELDRNPDLNDNERQYIRSASCTVCFQKNCRCDENYQASVDNRLSETARTEVGDDQHPF